MSNNPLFSILDTITRLRDEIKDNNNRIGQRFDILEGRFNHVVSRLEGIEAKVDRIRVPTLLDRPSDPLNGTIPPESGDQYEKPFKALLASHWKNPDGSTRSSTEVDFVYKKVLGFAKANVEVLKPHHYKPDVTGRTWNFLQTKEQDRLVQIVEDYAVTYGVYLQHCVDGWLTRKILTRRLLDFAKKSKAKENAEG